VTNLSTLETFVGLNCGNLIVVSRRCVHDVSLLINSLLIMWLVASLTLLS
jgi:hypothetical protein